MSTTAHPSPAASSRRSTGDEFATWRHALERALAGDGLRLAAQPIVDTVQADVVGYEILARFTGPPEAPPNVWFDWAEALGLGAILDARIVELSLQMRDFLPSDTFLTINVVPHHLEDPALASVFTNAGSLDRVVLELTEHSAIDDYNSIATQLAPLRAAGAKVAIDDAGSGYAGLQWLMALSPDLIKLDRALIDHIDEDEVKTALVEMLGSFADRIDAWVLAEGVERIAELEVLLRLGVPLAQGYLFCKPTLDLWPMIDPRIHEHLRYRTSAEMTEPTLAPLVETVATRAVDDAPVEDTCIVVDEWRQPLGLELPGCENARVLVVRPDETVRSALERAITRDAATRWHPVVCVNETRQTLGIVRMERLIHMLVRELTGSDATRGDQG